MRLRSPVLVVTDRHQARRPLEQIVAEVVSAGARWIWFRDRDLEIAERRRLAFRLSEIVQDAGGRLSIGGDIELAAETRTNAVHVGTIAAVVEARRRLGPTALVGLSAHSVAEVADAQRASASYVTLSPIYQSASKPGYGPPLGAKAIERAALLPIPVLALGGITAENAAAVFAAGAAGVAIMGDVMRAEKPADIVSAMLHHGTMMSSGT